MKTTGTDFEMIVTRKHLANEYSDSHLKTNVKLSIRSVVVRSINRRFVFGLSSTYRQVLNKRGGQLYVDLKRPEDDEPTQDDDRPASVRDALVFLEVARFVSPVSKPNGGLTGVI